MPASKLTMITHSFNKNSHNYFCCSYFLKKIQNLQEEKHDERIYNHLH